ncbi:MFS transporter [Virgisporangium aliadipatigenens]|nr:MFS transporter [Virgisporangium aliadipatigenens]
MSGVTPGGPPSPRKGTSGGGGAAFKIKKTYSVIVFIVLASLDNVAIQLVPPLYDPIARAFEVPEGVVAVVTAVTYLVTAVAAVGWAFAGDRGNRRPLLVIGTILWAVGTAATGWAPGLTVFVIAQVVGAIGLGAVGSVGFSVVSDLISPRRRGLVMSLWGLSQGIGTLAGTLAGGLLGAADWRRPFQVMAVTGTVAAVAYLFTADIRRGESEPQLAGVEYDHRISREQLPEILGRRTNVWLVLQGLSAQVTFGSFVWLPRLFQARAEEQGYDSATAVAIGAVFATLFQLGGVLSIIGGLVGDRLQRRTPRGRALVASAGILGGVPFFVGLFFLPMRVHIDEGSVPLGVLKSVYQEPTVAFALLAALSGLALTSANSPNWFALIADVNPPEHRGTVYSLGNLVNGVGRAAGNGLVGLVFSALARSLPPPANYAVGLAAFQVFFVPTGIMYYMASRTSPKDIDEVREVLAARAAEAGVRPSSSPP